MSTIMPQSELVRKAVQWIAESLGATPDTVADTDPAACKRLVQEAGMRFNLSPKEQEFLAGFFAKDSEQDG